MSLSTADFLDTFSHGTSSHAGFMSLGSLGFAFESSISSILLRGISRPGSVEGQGAPEKWVVCVC